MPPRAAGFDFDGVLVDSEPLHFRSLRDALQDDGIAITEEEYWGIYLAHDDRGAIRLALEQHGHTAEPQWIEAIAARKAARFAELIPEVPVFPGAREIVAALGAEIPLAIASGARHGEIEAILAGLALPDPFLARLAESAPDLLPTECLAFEDSVPGIASALGAGMKVVGVAHSFPEDKLRSAHRVVGSLVGLARDNLRGLFP